MLSHCPERGTSTIFSFLLLAVFAFGANSSEVRAAQVRPLTFTRQIHLARPATGGSRYAYVPFAVPPRARRITVAYGYDRAAGANTLDLGLFDSRSTARDEDPRGFRGWSGGRRDTVFIARDEATPGYVPGDLPAGTWHVILGLYRVAAQGVDVSFTFTIEMNPDAPTNISDTPRVFSAAPPPSGRAFSQLLELAPRPEPSSSRPTGRRWYRGDLHAHTLHSDGDWTVAELARAARQTGLDFISVTDHNTLSHHAEIARLPSDSTLVLRGEEVTTYGGHVNAWGLPANAMIDFRVRPGDRERMAQVVEEIHRAGALASVNHPFALCGGCDWSYDRALHGFDSIEVWNGAWDFTDERALGLWDALLQTGRRITAVGSSDTHRPANALGSPTTHVSAADLSERDLLEGIRRGGVYVTREATNSAITFTAESKTEQTAGGRTIGDELTLKRPGVIRLAATITGAPDDAAVFFIAGGRNIQIFPPPATDAEKVVEFEVTTNTYFRIEVRDRAGAMLAFTNPVYVKIKNSPPVSAPAKRR